VEEIECLLSNIVTKHRVLCCGC